MATKWFIGLMMAWVILTVMSNMQDGAYLSGSDAQDLVNATQSVQGVDYTSASSSAGGAVVAVGKFLSAAGKALMWDYSFMTGGYVILRYLGMCVSFALLLSFALAIRGVSSG